MDGYDRIITRKWIATDISGNKTECQHQIKVSLLSISEIVLPPDFDGTDRNALNCDEVYNKAIDVNSHIANSPFCIDGFYWILHIGMPIRSNQTFIQTEDCLGYWDGIASKILWM